MSASLPTARRRGGGREDSGAVGDAGFGPGGDAAGGVSISPRLPATRGECAPTLRGRVVDSRDAPPLLPLAQSWQPPGDRSHITFAPDPGPRPAWLVRLLPVLRRQPTGGACQAGDLITGEIRTSATCEESPADGSEELTLGATLGSADLQVLDDVRTRGAPEHGVQVDPECIQPLHGVSRGFRDLQPSSGGFLALSARSRTSWLTSCSPVTPVAPGGCGSWANGRNTGEKGDVRSILDL